MSAELPSDWGHQPIGRLVREGRPICYGVLKPGDYHSTGIPLVRIVDLEGDEVDEASLFRIGRVLDAEFARSRLNGGEILLSIQGTIGRVAIAPSGLRGANISRTIARIDVANGASASFVRHWMRSAVGQRAFDDTIVGTTRSSLNIGALRKISVPLPPLPEQRRIAEILDTIDEAIRKTEQVIAKLQEMKQGLLHDLLTRGIDENGELRDPERHPEQFKDSPLGRIPRGWEVLPLGEVAEFVTSGSRGWASFYSETGALFIRIGNLTREHINMRFDSVVRVQPPRSSEGRRTLAEEGDLLISITADLGIIGVVPVGLGEAYVNQHVSLVRLDRRFVNPRWVGHFLATGVGQKQFTRRNDQGAKAGLNLPAVAGVMTAVPPMREQLALVETLDGHDMRIAREARTAEKLHTLKQALMDDLLTGRVRVPLNEPPR